jgi:hypothetical protein
VDLPSPSVGGDAAATVIVPMIVVRDMGVSRAMH